MDTVNITNVFKALSDKNRMEILFLLQNGEMCACDLLENLEISQSTLSHHMKILLCSEIVVERKNKKWSFYSINCSKIHEANNILEKLTNIKKSGNLDHCK